MGWLSLALGLVRLLNAVMGFVEAKDRERVARAVIEAENLQADLKVIADANSARDAVVRDAGDDLGRVRTLDPNARKSARGGARSGKSRL